MNVFVCAAAAAADASANLCIVSVRTCVRVCVHTCICVYEILHLSVSVYDSYISHARVFVSMCVYGEYVRLRRVAAILAIYTIVSPYSFFVFYYTRFMTIINSSFFFSLSSKKKS